MSLSTTSSQVTYAGNGVTTTFPYTFPIQKAAHLVVQITNTTTLASTTLDASQYSATGIGGSSGGVVTYPVSGSPLAAGYVLTISRIVPLTQTVQIPSQGPFLSDVVEDAFDYVTMAIQQVNTQMSQTVQFPPGITPDAAMFISEVTAAAAEASAAAAAITTYGVGVVSATGTLSAGQDTITLPWTYDMGTKNVSIFLAGVKQAKDTLTAIDGTHIKLGSAVGASTKWEAVKTSILSDTATDTLLSLFSSVSASSLVYNPGSYSGYRQFRVVNTDPASGSGAIVYVDSNDSTLELSSLSSVDGGGCHVKASCTNGGLAVGTINSKPVFLLSNNIERARIEAAGDFGVTNPDNKLGYNAGSGGTVTQSTSKATIVTLNKPCGKITMNAASLAAGAAVTFAVNNSLVTSTDIPVVALSNTGSGLAYEAWVSYTYNGGFYITLKNISGGALAEAVIINFAIIKGVTS